jgi:RimJ/RimL family protein N-acetyltransferase
MDKKPILRDFPDSFDTERLTIRSPLPGDGKELRAAVLESHAELKKWLPWAIDVADEEGYEENIRNGRIRFLSREDLWLMLLLKGTNTIIGGSGLHRINWRVPKFEIGYWVRTSHAGKGYITEAVSGITAFAFDTLGAKRVEIRCDALNVRSAIIPQRLGFTLEGTLHNDDRDHLTNQLRHTMIFAKYSQEHSS